MPTIQNTLAPMTSSPVAWTPRLVKKVTLRDFRRDWNQVADALSPEGLYSWHWTFVHRRRSLSWSSQFPTDIALSRHISSSRMPRQRLIFTRRHSAQRNSFVCPWETGSGTRSEERRVGKECRSR